jgi:hypothetical protein
MRLDRDLYVTFHDQLADTVQHLGSTFVDGSVYPRFGTLEDKQFPFFIEWKSLNHPFKGGKAKI